MDRESAIYYLADLESDVFYSLIDNWRANRGKNKLQTWPLIPANLLIKEYNYNVATGLVHDSVIDKIQSIAINCYLSLYINTILMGHTSSNPLDYASCYDDLTDGDLDDYSDYATDERGQWRLSDYGLDKIGSYAVNLLCEDDYNKKLAWIDAILNIAHQRGDLAALFVEGGSKTLNRLAERIT